MKEENKVLIATLKKRLQNRMHYDNINYAFDVLFHGWRKKAKKTDNWNQDVKKRGWISKRDAHDFAVYCGYPIDEN